jgi:hypothetical protein
VWEPAAMFPQGLVDATSLRSVMLGFNDHLAVGLDTLSGRRGRGDAPGREDDRNNSAQD